MHNDALRADKEGEIRRGRAIDIPSRLYAMIVVALAIFFGGIIICQNPLDGYVVDATLVGDSSLAASHWSLHPKGEQNRSWKFNPKEHLKVLIKVKNIKMGDMVHKKMRMQHLLR